MKKKVAIICILVLAAAVLFCFAGNILLLPAACANSWQLTWEENSEIKSLVLDAVRDRCSSLYAVDQDEIYDAEAAEEIVQYDAAAGIEKDWFCLIDPGFMRTVTKTGENRYSVIVKTYSPEDLYYHFTVQKDGAGNYVITSFLLDM